jgi:hypothetical protein
VRMRLLGTSVDGRGNLDKRGCISLVR